MAPLLLENLILPAAISLLHAYQLAKFARRVGAARQKFKVPYPACSGDDSFMRYFRAQQNSIEFAPIFFPCLWASALFFHPVPAALAGVVYCYGRAKYFEGYIEQVQKRIYGFGICVKSIQVQFIMAIVGIAHLTLATYAGIDVKLMVLNFVN